IASPDNAEKSTEMCGQICVLGLILNVESVGGMACPYDVFLNLVVQPAPEIRVILSRLSDRLGLYIEIPTVYAPIWHVWRKPVMPAHLTKPPDFHLADNYTRYDIIATQIIADKNYR
ncbi:MAG: hypothetical protein KKF80_03115, partial [Candidatus Omnitrophica bacterium]|nr:hypothetical protein [Candidatus Omnitrophota bacterium]